MFSLRKQFAKESLSRGTLSKLTLYADLFIECVVKWFIDVLDLSLVKWFIDVPGD